MWDWIIALNMDVYGREFGVDKEVFIVDVT
jgi:hypothetical protein